jgi:bacillithiol biosynthesis deacetylase BshB1
MIEPLHFLTFGPHPDDAEIGTGAFLLKMKNKGYRTGMIILTEGEMGAGTPEIRQEEARLAARDLKLDVFEVLDLGDTRLADTHENRVRVAGLVRKYRPQVVLAPYYGLEPGRGRGHSDHIVCGELVTHGTNFAHLEKYPAEGPAYAVKKIFYYFLPPFMRPSFIVPVDDEFPQALQALGNHKSQFEREDRPRVFPSRLQSFGGYLGAQIGAKYGQAFYVQDPLRIEDPLPLFAGEPRVERQAVKGEAG